MGLRLGILGGMGPLASAEFLKTIYELNMPSVEQGSPSCILYSDPAFPDRTQTIRSGSGDAFITALVAALEALCRFDVARVVITCITSHCFLPRLPDHLRRKLISLVDIVIEDILPTRKRYLLLGTDGARIARIFEGHDQWARVRPRVAVPSDQDQRMVHDTVYRLKRNERPEPLAARLASLAGKYKADVLIAACTEFHLLAKHWKAAQNGATAIEVLDPLLVLARDLKRFLGDAAQRRESRAC